MWVIRFQKEVFQRLACLDKSNAYFIHSQSLLPAVLIVPAQKMHRVRPIISHLSAQKDFNLVQELNNCRVDVSASGQQKQQGSRIDSINKIGFNEETRFMQADQSGRLQITKHHAENDRILGVLLFASSIQSHKIRYIAGNYVECCLILMKIATIVLIFLTVKTLRVITRYQNHHELN